jgi:hypothetical protein
MNLFIIFIEIKKQEHELLFCYYLKQNNVNKMKFRLGRLFNRLF